MDQWMGEKCVSACFSLTQLRMISVGKTAIQPSVGADRVRPGTIWHVSYGQESFLTMPGRTQSAPTEMMYEF